LPNPPDLAFRLERNQDIQNLDAPPGLSGNLTAPEQAIITAGSNLNIGSEFEVICTCDTIAASNIEDVS
jgi:hypothetical protein